ncbi:MAG: DUF4385 domain-containing protein [Parachlamydiales bacterium]|nr:DUF4385 domain-containing protein [Parachlamydiales bacterium]
MTEKKRSKNFDESKYAWKNDIDYRLYPELYRVGKGEQGVLLCEPYKSEILPYWKFKTPEIAQVGADTIFSLFLNYLQNDEFVGADMARKFLQMGFTRSRRYANYKGGRKYRPHSDETYEKGSGDPIKVKSASIYFAAWKKAEEHPLYKEQKIEWKKKYG